MSEAWEDILLEMDSKLMKFAEEKYVSAVSCWFLSPWLQLQPFVWTIQITFQLLRIFYSVVSTCSLIGFIDVIVKVLGYNRKSVAVRSATTFSDFWCSACQGLDIYYIFLAFFGFASDLFSFVKPDLWFALIIFMPKLCSYAYDNIMPVLSKLI